MAPPSVPKKRMVHLRENEELAAKILVKHRSMMAEQLSEHQGQALSAAHRGVCLAKLPFRTPRDLSRIKGVGDWVIRVMEDSFPGSSLGLSAESNTPGGTGKKRKRTKPYVPKINSAPYAIVIILYRQMIRGNSFMMRGKGFMMKQELIDAVEASGLSRHGICPNNYKSKQLNSCKDMYTGWSCMTTLISNKLVKQWSNPTRYELTDKGIETACGFLDHAGPSNPHSEEVFSDSDSDDQYERSNHLIGSENFAERTGVRKSTAGSSSSFCISMQIAEASAGRPIGKKKAKLERHRAASRARFEKMIADMNSSNEQRATKSDARWSELIANSNAKLKIEEAKAVAAMLTAQTGLLQAMNAQLAEHARILTTDIHDMDEKSQQWFSDQRALIVAAAAAAAPPS